MAILTEYSPKQPDNIIFKSSDYPSGIKERDIYDYYMSKKERILKWINNRYVATFLYLENGSEVVIRKHKNKPIKLTDSNFKDIITGRTRGLYVQIDNPSNYVVIDIDRGDGISFKELVQCYKECLKILSKFYPVTEHEILYSGRGLHLILQLSKKIFLDKAYNSLKYVLKEEQDKYLVNEKGRKRGTINLDLSVNNINGIHICRYGLTKNFLICDDIRTSKFGGKIKIA